MALMIAGLAGSVLLMGMGELLRQIDSFLIAYDERSTDLRNLALVTPDRPGQPGGAAVPAHTFDEIVLLLREVRDISLLTEEQRRKRLDAQSGAVHELLEREVPVLLREHNWIEARSRVQEARARFPQNPAWDKFERQIEQTRTQVEEHDIEAAERHVADLTTLGAWDRVAEVVNELLQRHPDSIKARELAQQIRASKNKAEAEQRARLMAQAQEATNKRDWATALQCAVTLAQRFPRSPEAQALRMQLPVLRENTEIQTRQRMEAQIREHVRDHRYAEALRLVQELIDQYPSSPQAEALREQLPKLQEKAAVAAR
jgi:outer membrane protein assembly factor BamD (BamD/ComL family)